MCRSIKLLRTPNGPSPETEIQAAALQYIRKVSGFRAPSEANRPAFDAAVTAVAEASAVLLAALPPKRESPSATPSTALASHRRRF